MAAKIERGGGLIFNIFLGMREDREIKQRDQARDEATKCEPYPELL